MNRLGSETSPYLRQHAENPVHWWPWSSAALAEAKETGKPILLSVGYAACHWCHVMAHESFEDAQTADVMNDLYVCIKVDREERPDIDQIYMAALNATGEQGGWPLTMFLTPDAKPFWGGTYFPPRPAHRRPSFVEVLRAVNDAWQTKQPQLMNSANVLNEHVSSRLAPDTASAQLSATPLESLAKQVSSMIDPDLGGLKGAPKFPNVPFMDALWINSLNTEKPEGRQQVIESLRKMLAGGIYDHVGGGLCRYSTDAHWLIPHFEKMLYDNAQLVRQCCHAYAQTGDDIFSEAIERTLAWIDRELTTDMSGFASSLDADSEGEEGKFYTWTAEDVEKTLGAGSPRFFEFYALAKPREWEGDPVVIERPNARSGHESIENRATLEALRLAREERPRPARDDKMLTDWNGLAIRAYAEAGRLFDRPEWIDRAVQAYRCISESMIDRRLPHSALGKSRLFPGLSSDYASMINAAISLFEATGDRKFVDQAIKWSDALDQWHADGEGSHFLTASDASDTPIRIRGDSDDPVPSATAQIIEALTRLSSATGDFDIYERARKAAEAAMGRAEKQIYGQAGIYTFSAIADQPMKLIIAEQIGSSELSEAAKANPDPRRVDITIRYESGKGPGNIPAGFNPADAPAAWLCQGNVCLAPISNADELKRALKQGPR